MNINKIILLLSLITLLYHNGCNKDLTEPEYYDLDVYSYLPLQIGNYWEYIYTDGTVRAIIKTEIKNKITHEDGSLIYGYYQGLVLSNPNPTEPVNGYYSAKENAIYYYSSPKDTMMISGTSILTLKIPIIKTPLTKGAYWIVKNDTFSVESFTSIKVNEIIYDKSILIVKRNNVGIDSTWFAKDIGIVKIKSGNSISSAEMNLKSYSLK